MILSQIQEEHKSSTNDLKKGLSSLPIEEQILISAQKILDREATNSFSDKTLRDHQIPVYLNFGDYLINLATSPENDSISVFCRIVLPPRTGKTVVACKIINMTELCSTFVVPTKSLVEQTLKEMNCHLPNVPVGQYYSDKKELVENGINITTYASLQRLFSSARLPEPIINSGLIFFDEAHHSMTASRVKIMNEAFAEKAIRIALTATPDYNEERQLHQFFPELIHELELLDAFERGILAPSRMWVVEVDSDASKVRFIAGEFEQDLLGRIMSSIPFFKAVELFRYSKSNKKIPTLITCTSRQQAYDLWEYLKKYRPSNTPKPGLVLSETSSEERKKCLRDFDQGKIDTLIQVGVLIEGWNSPHCKLLLDLAPSMSLVRATQKYFRVMTKYKDHEARIVVFLPKYLPRPPILPIDLLLKPGEDYSCGDLLSSDTSKEGLIKTIDRIKQPTVQSIQLKSRVIASAWFAKPDLDPKDRRQIRQVLMSCPEFKLKLRFGDNGFKRLFFNHPLFIGNGKSLLRYLEIPNGKKAFHKFLKNIFPDEYKKEFPNNPNKSCYDDFNYILQHALLPNSSKNGTPQEPFLSTINSLCGGIKEIVNPEERMIIQEEIDIILNAFKHLTDREQKAVYLRLGFFGKPELSWSELGIEFNVSKERSRQIYHKALRRLRLHYIRATHAWPKFIKYFSEYPDIFKYIQSNETT